MKLPLKLWAILLAASLANAETVSAQTYSPLDSATAADMLAEIAASSSDMQTLKCSFVQRQELSGLSRPAISEGILYYKKADRMRWEYTEPEKYSFIVSGSKVVQERDGNIQKGEGATLFGRIARLILPGISGQSIVNEKDFTAEYSVSDNTFRVSMIPKKGNMRRMINTINLHFDMKTKFIQAIEMLQQSNVTRIEFKDEIINQPIEDKLFEP
jgi:outer membrane lipoprotein carrier protein